MSPRVTLGLDKWQALCVERGDRTRLIGALLSFSENQSHEGRRKALFMGKLNIWLNGLSFRMKEAKTARVDKHPQSLEPTLKRAGEGR